MRIREKDLMIPAMRAALEKPNNSITTIELIEELSSYFQPKGEDADLLNDRKDSKFSQKVRNLISHRTSPKGMYERGYATYHKETETTVLTSNGVAFLDQVPE